MLHANNAKISDVLQQKNETFHGIRVQCWLACLGIMNLIQSPLETTTTTKTKRKNFGPPIESKCFQTIYWILFSFALHKTFCCYERFSRLRLLAHFAFVFEIVDVLHIGEFSPIAKCKVAHNRKFQSLFYRFRIKTIWWLLSVFFFILCVCMLFRSLPPGRGGPGRPQIVLLFFCLSLPRLGETIQLARISISKVYVVFSVFDPRGRTYHQTISRNWRIFDVVCSQI